MYLELAESPLDYKPYVPIKSADGSIVWVREDYFDTMSDAGYEEFEDRNYQTQVEENGFLNDGDYLSSRADRKKRRAERDEAKKAKKAAKTYNKKATADKRRAKGEAKKTRADAKKAKADKKGGGGDDDEDSGESKFDKWSGKAMDLYGKVKGGGGGAGGDDDDEPKKKDNTMLYVGIGAGVLLLGGLAYAATSKPKAAKAA